MAKPAAAWVTRWTTGASAAQQTFTDGVNNTSVDVVGRAIAGQSAAIAGYTQALTSGRWAAKLQHVGNAGWKAATVKKAANYGTGIAAGHDKYSAFASKAAPLWATGQASIAGMPRGGGGAAKARMNAWFDYASSLKGQF